MAPALFRDSFVGYLIYQLSGHRLLQYQEDRPGFVVPPPTIPSTDEISSSGAAPKTGLKASSDTPVAQRPDDEESRISHDASSGHETLHQSEETKGPRPNAAKVEEGDLAEERERASVQGEFEASLIVSWYGPNDPENPRNWSMAKKCFVTAEICILTFSIYIGSSLYSPGIISVVEDFHVSPVAATLGLTLFVIGYGVGPMFLSPLSEIPHFGRTTVYILSLALFVVLQVPTALAKNLGALLPLRFLAGFAGSPALATGGASLSDMWAPETQAVAIGLWGVAAVSGPVLGPLLGGFASQSEGWTWTIWILLWMSGGSLAFLMFFLPETSVATLLYRRAARLRRITGDKRYRSEGEIEAQHMRLNDVAMMTLVRPFILMFVEPIVAFWNIYIGIVYGIIYIFIESFAVVFVEHHGFNIGQNGLAFLGVFVGAMLTFLIYVPYALKTLKPRFLDGTFVPEMRMPIAMLGCFFLPASLFWFGWTSGGSVHWIVPILASALFSAGVYTLFAAGLNYLTDCYPRYVASVLAGNDFFRAMVGAAFPLFSTAFFHNLGVGPACSILAGITVLMIPIPWILYYYGARIRAYSKYAD